MVVGYKFNDYKFESLKYFFIISSNLTFALLGVIIIKSGKKCLASIKIIFSQVIINSIFAKPLISFFKIKLSQITPVDKLFLIFQLV